MSKDGDDLAGRVALVTGGGRGIGRAVCLALAERGAAVAVNWKRDEAAAAQVVQRIVGAGGTAIAVQAAVDDPFQCEAMVDHVARGLGPIGILVSNAGVASRGGSVVDSEPQEFEQLIRVHALAAVHLCRLVVPGMRSLTRGDIVAISSVHTDRFDANGAPYGMAKAALEALAFTLAKEELQNGIHVNVVAPGLVASEMGDRLTKAMTGGEVSVASGLDAEAPFDHICRPEEVASVVQFLVSSQASYITGQRIAVDGGSQSYLR